MWFYILKSQDLNLRINVLIISFSGYIFLKKYSTNEKMKPIYLLTCYICITNKVYLEISDLEFNEFENSCFESFNSTNIDI